MPHTPGTAGKWTRDGGGLLLTDTKPDTVEDRNERLAWLIRNSRPWKLLNGHLIAKPSDIDAAERDRAQQEESIGRALWEAMHLQRGQSKQMMRELGLAGGPTAAEGTYGALGAYPLAAELTAVTPTATESGLVSAANGGLYLPIPANGILAPQAWRFVISGRLSTDSATAANYTWTIRLGNANTSPSLGASIPLAKTVSLTNPIFMLKGDITIQSVGAPGTNARGMGHFDAKLNSASGGAYTAWLWGSTAQASFDATVAPNTSANGGQLWTGITASAAAADAWAVSQIHWMDWN
jgi:hypothetical protein